MLTAEYEIEAIDDIKTRPRLKVPAATVACPRDSERARGDVILEEFRDRMHNLVQDIGRAVLVVGYPPRHAYLHLWQIAPDELDASHGEGELHLHIVKSL